jgi:hypothetical protein
MDAMTQYLLSGQLGMTPGQYFSNQYLMNGANSSPASAYLGGISQRPSITSMPAASPHPVMGLGPQGYGSGMPGMTQQPGVLSNNTPAGQNANQGLQLLMQALIKKAKKKPTQQQNNPAPEPGANDLPTSNSGSSDTGGVDAGSGDGSQP